MIVPSATAKKPQINAAVSEVVRELTPQVQYIRYNLAQDWSGDPAIYFRVLLSDEASKMPTLIDVASKVESLLSEKIDFSEIGVFAYFNYRNQFEQAQMRDPEWA